MKDELVIGVTTHGHRCRWLRDMLNGLYWFTKVKFKVIIVDNASEDGTLNYLERLMVLKNLEIIRNRKNIDDSGGMNQILNSVSSQYLLKIDTDTLLTQEGSVDTILNQMKQTGASLVGPYWDLSLRRRKEIEVWEHSLGMRKKFDRADEIVRTIDPHFEVTTRLPRGNFMLMNVDHVRKVGGFDSRYPHNAMEYSLAMRLLEAGMDYAGYFDDSVIHRPTGKIRSKVRAKLPDLLGKK